MSVGQQWTVVGPGDTDGALEDFNSALQIDPKMMSAQHQIGLTKLKRRDVEGALEAYSAVLAHDPDDVVALANRGMLAMNHHKVCCGRLGECMSCMHVCLCVYAYVCLILGTNTCRNFL